MIEKSKKDMVDKIIEAEIQKTGENIGASASEHPELRVSLEEMQKEFQEILKKSKAYEDAAKGEISFMEEERRDNSKRFSSFAKAAVIFLVAGACLFGLSMKSEATRMWWLKSVEKIVGEDRREAVNNDENRVIYDTTEDEAREQILTETGIPMPGMAYRSEDMSFDGYSYDKDLLRGELYYLYDEYVVTIMGYTTKEDSSFYVMQDGTIVSEDVIETSYGEVALFEVVSEGDASSKWLAEWEHQDNKYQLMGKVPKEEMKKIIENIFY